MSEVKEFINHMKSKGKLEFSWLKPIISGSHEASAEFLEGWCKKNCKGFYKVIRSNHNLCLLFEERSDKINLIFQMRLGDLKSEKEPLFSIQYEVPVCQD